MKRLLTVLAVALAVQGGWNHDWRTILAAVSVYLIWPLISAEVYDEDSGWEDGAEEPAA